MMAIGFSEILVLALLSGGMSQTDLAVLIPPTHYFQSRQIEVSIDKMIETARAEPRDPKTQIMQLTALRYLADETDALKKSPKYAAHRESLEQIAQGKKAQDALGFAKEYAARVLLRLDGGKMVVPAVPPIREDAVNWFPADTNLAAVFDLRQSRTAFGGKDPLKDLLTMMPDAAKKEMYEHLEKIGNVRVDRLAFGMVEHAKDKEKHKFMIRITGKANQVWLLDALKQVARKKFEAKQFKDAQDTPITLIHEEGSEPAVMMVGNTDLLLVGYGNNQANHAEIAQEILALRAKQKPNATTGVLKERLAKVPETAIAMYVGSLPGEMLRELRILFEPAPTHLSAHLLRSPQGMDVQLETTMNNADDAGKLVNKVGMLRKDAIQAMQKAQQQPPAPGFPPLPYVALINLMESLQVQNQDAKMQMRVLVPDGLLQQFGTMSMMFGTRRGALDAPPPPVIEIKKN